jgi:F-type H+-transporting ATPase subunit delta
MKEARIAIRYSKALFELALEKDLLEDVYQDMVQLGRICTASRDFVLMIKSPVIKTEKKRKILRQVFGKTFREISQRFLEIIIARGREGLIHEIANQYIILYKEHKNILTARLTSAKPLDEEEKKRIIDMLRRETGAEIELVEEVRKELIGGYVLSFGNLQYNASLSKKIHNLQKEFDVNPYVRGF